MRARVDGLPLGRRGFTSEDLPEVEFVPTAVRAAILDGKDVNLATLLMPNFDLGEYSRYSESDHAQFLRPLSSDPRLNRNLTLAEFITASINIAILCVKYGTGGKN